MLIPIATAALPRSGNLAFRAQRDTHAHNGIDLPAREGTPVVAPAAGVVRYATREWLQGFTGYGRVVVLEHPERGMWTLYAHLEQPLVTVGQRVSEGDPIGLVGRTQYRKSDPTDSQPRTMGAHLHFEVSPRAYPQANTEPRIDPVAWLEHGRDYPLPAPEPDGSREAEIPFGQAEARPSQASLCCPSCGSRLVLSAEPAHE